MAKNKTKTEPIRNPELDQVIAEMKQSSPGEKQDALIEALKKAKLLSPCDFDVDIQQQKDGTILNAHPSQIKFYLLNTNDGKTLFPVFTAFEHAKNVQFGKGIEPKLVVRAVKDFDQSWQGQCRDSKKSCRCCRRKASYLKTGTCTIICTGSVCDPLQ